MNVWTVCRGQLSVTTIQGKLIRIVESQEQIATTSLVDSLAEQAVLEDLLERTKPPPPASANQLRYLLMTPFRYPPLPHGSRFGSRTEPSLFHGAQKITASLSEAAYYRFVFWAGMTSPPPSPRLITQHTIFTVNYKTDKGIQLQNTPFNAYERYISDPKSYSVSQQLGHAMRTHGIEGFEYNSARDPGGINIALYTPNALLNKKPTDKEAWLCETTANTVRFSGHQGHTIHQYALGTFTIGGHLP